ncbi:MAG: cadmium-translocating P-type ATPase [Acidobacteria bacterium]|nr:MAG: cadmium-translocating P-type ATPase [Acidobacteriota bacterium]
MVSLPVAGEGGRGFWARLTVESYIAVLSSAAILAHLAFRFLFAMPRGWQLTPLAVALILGGAPLIWKLARRLAEREISSDLLAGISIITAVILGEFLVAAIVVLMLSGGTALEAFATRRASSVLRALSKRMPHIAHRKIEEGVRDVELDQIEVGNALVVFPHEICPVDGRVVEGHGVMDESYLTGEPFMMPKTPGSAVLSGAINQDRALTIVAEKRAVDSRYARIMQVMRESEQRRPRLRRLADRLGSAYTPAAVLLAAAGWLASGDPHRFLAVIVIATPCPLIIAIPVAIISSISLSARHSIIIKNPAALEQIAACRTLIFDKTGTLTYGKPSLTEILPAPGFKRQDILKWTASVEVYSKHPLAGAVLIAANHEGVPLDTASEVSERPGEGLQGTVGGRSIFITGRSKISAEGLPLPPAVAGLECLLFVDGRYAATLRFRDTPRQESRKFITHLGPRHEVNKIILLSGDRESEVRYLADQVGIEEVHANVSPEEKVAIVEEETRKAKTLFVGDGINDAPALQVATVGVAFGVSSDITSEAADAVVLSASLEKTDVLIHIGRRMRTIALQSAVGGMALSLFGMILAVAGYLPPLEGAVAQEIIDLAAVLNAVRAALPFGEMTDF